jgi:MFS family permease
MVCVMSIAGPSLDHAGHSATLIGLTLSAHVVGMFFFSPWIGVLADRWGRRPVLLASALLLVGGTSMVALLPLGVLFSFALFVIGVGWSFAFIGATAVIADAVPPLRRGRATGLVDFASASSGALGALGGGWALSSGGLGAVGIIGASLAVALALAAAGLSPAGLGARSTA